MKYTMTAIHPSGEKSKTIYIDHDQAKSAMIDSAAYVVLGCYSVQDIGTASQMRYKLYIDLKDALAEEFGEKVAESTLDPLKMNNPFMMLLSMYLNFAVFNDYRVTSDILPECILHASGSCCSVENLREGTKFEFLIEEDTGSDLIRALSDLSARYSKDQILNALDEIGGPSIEPK